MLIIIFICIFNLFFMNYSSLAATTGKINVETARLRREANVDSEVVELISLNEEVEILQNGVEIEGYQTKPAKVKILKTDMEKQITRLEIKIHEGRNRQVRKMCEAIGKKVLALHRSKIGNIDVKYLKIGTWRYLEEREVNSLLQKDCKKGKKGI